jgi:hypothetical protein
MKFDHSPQAIELTRGPTRTLYRHGCACGWVGAWQESHTVALLAWAAHLELIAHHAGAAHGD